MLTKPHAVFLCLALVFGGILVFLIPPFAAPDEPAHFLRTAELAQGAVWTRSHFPKQFVAFIQTGISPDFRKESIPAITEHLRTASEAAAKSHDLTELPYNRASVYSPAPYLLALPAIWLGWLLGLSPFTMIYVTRFAVFLGSTLVLYAAIRITPRMKWQMLLLALFPTTIFIRSCVNADQLTMAYIFLLLALFFRSAAGNRVSLKQATTIGVVSALVCLSKSAYILIPLLLLALPRRKFSSTRFYMGAMGIMVALPMLLGAGWSVAMEKIVQAHPFPQVDVTQHHHNEVWTAPLNVDARAQIAEALHSPDHFLQVFYNSWVSYETVLRLIKMIGTLGLNDIILPVELTLFLFLMLFTSADISSGSLPAGGVISRMLAFTIFSVTLTMISLLLYASWTPLGYPTILGIQGRYFTPIMPLLLMAIPTLPIQPKTHKELLYVMLFVLLLELSAGIYMMGKVYYQWGDGLSGQSFLGNIKESPR